jgi:polysaccharide biosynthesis/export protein
MKNLLTLALVGFFSVTALAQTQAAGQNAITDLLLKSGDVVSVYVWRNPDLTRARISIVDGKVDLPSLGKVQAEGLSVAEFRQLIQGRLSKYVSEPNVTVALMGIAPPAQQR